MTDRVVEYLNKTKVFQEKDGSIYFIKEIQTYPFVTINQNGDNVYAKQPSKVEQTHVTPIDLGYSRSLKRTVYVRKKLSTDQTITDEFIYFELPIEFVIPENDVNYRFCYLKAVRSGRIFVTDFNSATTYEASVNDKAICKRGKARKLENDFLLPNNAPVYEQNPSGELELFLREPTETVGEM